MKASCADLLSALDQPNLNLSPDERRLFGQVFKAADSEGIGVVTGDVALKFFPGKTKLPSEVLGEVRAGQQHTRGNEAAGLTGTCPDLADSGRRG